MISTKNTESESEILDTMYLVVIDRVKRKKKSISRVTDLLNREESRRTSFDDYGTRALVNEKYDA